MGTVIVILLGLTLLGLLVAHRIKQRNSIVEHARTLSDFTVTQDIVSVTTDIISSSPITGLALDETRRRICLITKAHGKIKSRVATYHDILSAEISENGTTVTRTSRTSQIGGALLGGLMVGPVGALIGGLSGKRYSDDVVGRLDLRIIVNDSQNPTHVITFLNAETKKKATTYAMALEHAQRWYAILKVVIEQADAEDRQAASSPAVAVPGPPSVVAEIRGLVDLRDSGILTEEEFQRQKAKLLSQ